MIAYLLWFRGNRDRTEATIRAATKAEAIAIFAARHDCAPSSYIACRKVEG